MNGTRADRRRGRFRIGLIVSAVLCLAGLPGPASAVMPPEAYLEARAAADHHVQVAIDRVRTPEVTPGQCHIKARVVTVFRSRGQDLAVGTPVTFAVDCLTEADVPPAGGTLWGRVEALRAARYMEVYLDGGLGALDVARWQYAIIDGPTPVPACPEESLSCS